MSKWLFSEKQWKTEVTLFCTLFFSDVGFKVGGDTRMNYFVLQIHYGDIKNFRGKYWCSPQSML